MFEILRWTESLKKSDIWKVMTQNFNQYNDGVGAKTEVNCSRFDLNVSPTVIGVFLPCIQLGYFCLILILKLTNDTDFKMNICTPPILRHDNFFPNEGCYFVMLSSCQFI